MSTYSIYALVIQHPEENVAAGDFNSLKVVAHNADDARQWAWRHAVREGNRNESIWVEGHDTVVAVSEFDEAPADLAPGTITEEETWTVECTSCGTELHKEHGLWVDAVSGDEGGTFEYCPANGGAYDGTSSDGGAHHPGKPHAV